MNLNVSLDSSITQSTLDSVNPGALKIFEWVCFTLNTAGYVPHIYETEANMLKFVMRKVKGSKITLRWDMQNRLVQFANYMFRVNQKFWPLKVVQDIEGGERISFFEIRVEGELLQAHDPISLPPELQSVPSSHIHAPYRRSSGWLDDQKPHSESSEPIHLPNPLALEESFDSLLQDLNQIVPSSGDDETHDEAMRVLGS